MNGAGRTYLKTFLIILLFFALVLTPSLLFGWQSLRRAEEAALAADFHVAAEQYELAAHRLFWRDELWNEVGKYNLFVGEKDAALTAYRKAQESTVLSAFGWDVLGKNAWEEGDTLVAIEFWESGLGKFPAYADFYARLAVAYRDLDDETAERNALKNWLALAPEDVDTAPYHYRLGLLLFLDDPDLALDELNTASRLDLGFASVVETLRTSLNLASLENDPAERLILLGRGLSLAEEWELAASAFHNATQADPENASAWAWLGESQFQLGQDAAFSFEMAESINPNSSTLLSLRGLYLQRRGELKSALLDFEKLAALEPENSTWQTSLGALHAELGDLPTALAAYEKAVELEPSEPIYRQLLALFSFYYSYDLEGTGLAAARRAVVLAPDEARFIDTLGLVYLGLGNDEDAERQFLHALEKDAEYAAAHLHLGILYLQRGHGELAYASLLRARELALDVALRDEAERLLEENFQE